MGQGVHRSWVERSVRVDLQVEVASDNEVRTLNRTAQGTVRNASNHHSTTADTTALDTMALVPEQAAVVVVTELDSTVVVRVPNHAIEPRVEIVEWAYGVGVAVVQGLALAAVVADSVAGVVDAAVEAAGTVIATAIVAAAAAIGAVIGAAAAAAAVASVVAVASAVAAVASVAAAVVVAAAAVLDVAVARVSFVHRSRGLLGIYRTGQGMQVLARGPGTDKHADTGSVLVATLRIHSYCVHRTRLRAFGNHHCCLNQDSQDYCGGEEGRSGAATMTDAVAAAVVVGAAAVAVAAAVVPAAGALPVPVPLVVVVAVLPTFGAVVVACSELR